MNKYIINGKELPIPSFFVISNLGGGGSDKYRETVYMDLYKNIPTLYNYYYLKYPGFAQKWLRNIEKFNTFGDFVAYVRKDMIETEQYICNAHKPLDVECNKTLYLLDSGARSFINNLAKTHIKDGSSKGVFSRLFEEIPTYYDFADRYKFDMVVGFDIGGKYTFKDGEAQNPLLVSLNEELRNHGKEINKEILIETIRYLKSKEYYPKVLATVHGKNPQEYKEYVEMILMLEKEYDYKFWGFALGGIASSKNIDDLWFSGVKPPKAISNSIVANYATQIVKKSVGDRPIHALGAGGINNIIPLFLSGATSFDSQSPGRRAYDGSGENALHVSNPESKGSYSKYLIGIHDSNLNPINEEYSFDYNKLNSIENTVSLCDCPGCEMVDSINDIRKLYSSKNKKKKEEFYYARQICNAHAIWQHVKLCELCSKNNTYDKIMKFIGNESFANIIDSIYNAKYNDV